MPEPATPRPVYTSFDRVPAPKGAAVHIAAFAPALASHLGEIDLVTPGEAELTAPVATWRWPGVLHHRLPATGRDLIARAGAFRNALGGWWCERRPVVQFRSIFEGYPLARHKQHAAGRLVFEVNGLPSVELKYHHRDVADDRELLRKLRAQEQACLDAADLVLTPSAVTADYLRSRGVDGSRLRVVPNGVDLKVFRPAPPGDRGGAFTVLYAGTHAPWQGIEVALEALARVRRTCDAELLVIGPTRGRQRQQVRTVAERFGVGNVVEARPPVPQATLARLMARCDAVVAPLPANDRNCEQGCCPLKVLEAMAIGRPLVASDLPVVRALVRHDEHALLVRPGSAKATAEALLALHRDRTLGDRLARAARRRVEAVFTWRHAAHGLAAAYREVLGISSVSNAASVSRSVAGPRAATTHARAARP